jgi:hypothetical protein
MVPGSIAIVYHSFCALCLSLHNPNPNPTIYDDYYTDSRNTSLLSSVDAIYIVIARESFVSTTIAVVLPLKQLLFPSTFKTVRQTVLALQRLKLPSSTHP